MHQTTMKNPKQLDSLEKVHEMDLGCVQPYFVGGISQFLTLDGYLLVKTHGLFDLLSKLLSTW